MRPLVSEAPLLGSRGTNGRAGRGGPGVVRAPGESEPSRALRALGSNPAIGGEPGGDRRDGGGVRGGPAAALPEGASAVTSHTGESAPLGWTGRLRNRWLNTLPPDKMLPDRQPAYVASWIYVFGVLTLSALLVVLISGGLLALKGPSWWHFSATGLFVNSLHLWSVELFMFFMVVHLWGKFFMAAWRGRRALTSARCSCGTSCCCPSPSACSPSGTSCWSAAAAWSRPSRCGPGNRCPPVPMPCRPPAPRARPLTPRPARLGPRRCRHDHHGPGPRTRRTRPGHPLLRHRQRVRHRVPRRRGPDGGPVRAVLLS